MLILTWSKFPYISLLFCVPNTPYHWIKFLLTERKKGKTEQLELLLTNKIIFPFSQFWKRSLYPKAFAFFFGQEFWCSSMTQINKIRGIVHYRDEPLFWGSGLLACKSKIYVIFVSIKMYQNSLESKLFLFVW